MGYHLRTKQIAHRFAKTSYVQYVRVRTRVPPIIKIQNYLMANIMLAGFSQYDFQRFPNAAMVAPSTTR